MTTVPKYTEQVARLRRSFERFREIDSGRVHDRDSHHYEDEVYGFFMNCHHLKDWFINDAAFGISKADVEDFINLNIDLQLCADICNSHKHLVLSRPRSTESPKMGARNFAVTLGQGPVQVSAKYAIDTKSGSVDAYKLATKCLDLWITFIKSRGGVA